jgi:hypothetical protein
VSDIPIKKVEPVHSEQEWTVGIDYPADGVKVRITAGTRGITGAKAVELAMQLLGWRHELAANESAA